MKRSYAFWIYHRYSNLLNRGIAKYVRPIMVISNTKIMEKVNPKYLGTLEHLWANNITENTRNAF